MTTITSVRESPRYVFVCLGVTLYSAICTRTSTTDCALEGGIKLCGLSRFLVVGLFLFFFARMWRDVMCLVGWLVGWW